MNKLQSQIKIQLQLQIELILSFKVVLHGTISMVRFVLLLFGFSMIRLI